jgi:hypothetical protein
MENREFHRIGGGSIDNLRLQPKEQTLQPPGFSILKCDSPIDAARQMQEAFPRAKRLIEATRTIGSTSVELIRGAGFDVIPVPSLTLPNHFRVIHPGGLAGFTDENLKRLAAGFSNTTGYDT